MAATPPGSGTDLLAGWEAAYSDERRARQRYGVATREQVAGKSGSSCSGR